VVVVVVLVLVVVLVVVLDVVVGASVTISVTLMGVISRFSSVSISSATNSIASTDNNKPHTACSLVIVYPFGAVDPDGDDAVIFTFKPVVHFFF
jgi:hypothetical protein